LDAHLKLRQVELYLLIIIHQALLQLRQADLDLTKKFKEGGKLLDIQVLDHIIITSESYYSFVDEGLL
jgi:hypothetical protein